MTRTGRPKSDNPKIKRIDVRMESDIYEAFSEKCDRLNIRKPDKVRELIIEFLDNKKE